MCEFYPMPSTWSFIVKQICHLCHLLRGEEIGLSGGVRCRVT
jgi:hypothetical protein